MEPQQTNSTNPIEATPLPSTACCGGHSRQWVIAGIIFVAAGLLVGGGVYAVMGKRLSSERTALTQQITDLQNQLAQLQTSAGTTISAVEEQNVLVDGAKNEPQVDTKNWKTYQNTKYGYAVNYPSNWFIKPNYKESDIDDTKNVESDTGVSVQNQNVDPVAMNAGGIVGGFEIFSISKQNADYIEMLNKIFNGKPGLVAYYNDRKITKIADLIINNRKSIKYIKELPQDFEGMPSYQVKYVIRKNNDYMIDILFVTRTKDEAEKNLDIFDQVAKSVKFE